VAEPAEPGPARPTPAGIYDYLLGGQHHSAADRAAAEQAMALTPANRTEVIENRAFLRRAVRYLASRGITQYVDLGSGYPASGAVHQTAAELITSPRVVYVDNDPRVAEVSRGLLDSPDTAVIVRDVRRPAEVIGDPQTRRLIDWSRPVAVLMVAILHFIRDEDDPAGTVPG
jgi:S-adenosyl methyltransferase